jgi:hypothetical protein
MASMLGTDAADLVTRIEPRRHLILPTAADNEDDIQARGGGCIAGRGGEAPSSLCHASQAPWSCRNPVGSPCMHA